MQAVDPLTGGEGRQPLVSASAKASICLGLVYASFICFSQAARYYVHLVSDVPSLGGALPLLITAL